MRGLFLKGLVATAFMLLSACSASPTPPTATAVPGQPNFVITVLCSEENIVMFEMHNTGDPVPSQGWAYRIVDDSGEVMEEGGTSLGTDETETIVMDDAGPYTLIIPDGNISQIGECP